MTTVAADDDRPLDELDDRADRDELRQRWYGLLQELRVILPGVQVLVAFLLTVPFAARFEELDATGRTAFLLSMMSGLVAVVCLLTPTAFHRIASRTARVDRLRWAVRLLVGGVAALAVSLCSALFCVTRFVFGLTEAAVMTVGLATLVVTTWVALPRLVGRGGDVGP